MNGAAAVAFKPANARTEIEQQIGETVADAAIMVCASLEAGGLTGAARTRMENLFVELYELQQSTLGDLDFAAVARTEGKRILWERHGATLLARVDYSETAINGAFDELIERALDVLRKVTAVERARMH